MALPRPSFSSALCYRDPKAALKWLAAAFGFEAVMVITDAEGNVAHSEMRFGNGLVMIGSEWSADHKSPASVSSKNTQTVHVHLDDIDHRHCARAGGGAEIIQAPETQFCSDRTYRARDRKATSGRSGRR
jgi:uncharacterized glyoxalase superfamily protein PhnB